MNKEQQIKEMANITYDKVKTNFGAKFKDIAEAIYAAGYRKIDENCAVITKDELKEYKMQAVKEFIEKCKEYSKIYDKYNVIYRDVVLDVLDESLKEFLKRLYRIDG